MSGEQLSTTRSHLMAPGETVALTITAGSCLRIAQVEGFQVADLVSFVAGDLAERLSMFQSRSANRSWRLSTGDTLLSTRRRPLWTIVEDSVGENYSGGGYCNPRVNQQRYGQAGTATCEGNLAAALKPSGLDRNGFDPDTCFNVFMNVGYDEDGLWIIRETPARETDFIVLRSEVDQVVGISNCPQMLSAVNARDLKRLELVITRA